MSDNYVVHVGPSQYTVLQDDEGYCVTQEDGSTVVVRYDAIPGPPPTPEQIAEAVAAWEAAHPEDPVSPEAIAAAVAAYLTANPLFYVWVSPGAVSVVDFDHPLGFLPNVQVVDSANTTLLTVPVVTTTHCYIDLGSLMSVTVTLS